MKAFLTKQWKILFLCVMVVLTCTACSSPRGSDGKTKVDEIISLEKIELNKDQVNISEISNEQLKEELENSPGDTITIEPTSWSSAWSRGWFDGLIVWPIAQLINLLASFTDAGWGIILTTLLIQLLIYAFTFKSQLSQQRMQEIQPEMQRIQDKYKDKKDQRSQMLMAQEMQALYSKYDIHPFSSILVMFIQLPVMMGMFYATMRAATTVYGSFMGMSLSVTPLYSFQHLLIGPIVVYVLMILSSLLTILLPKVLKYFKDKKSPVKKRFSAKQAEQSVNRTMNMTMYMTTAMVAFLYLSWPLAMSFYWLVSSVIRALLSVFSSWYGEKKAAETVVDTSGVLKNRRR